MAEVIGPVGTLPPGLLSLLGLKDRGVNPRVLSLEVGPSLDMLPFWLQQRAEVLSTTHTVTVTTAGGGFGAFTNNIDVPNDEIWYLHTYSVEAVMTAAAGQILEGFAPALSYFASPTAQKATLGPEIRTVNSLAAVSVTAMVTAQGIWVPPASRLGFYFGQVTSAAGIAFTGRARVTKMKV